MNRWIILFAGVLTQTVYGGIYAWTTFVPRLVETYALSKAQCGLVFGVTITVFTIAMTFAGRVITKIGTRYTAAIGAVMFMAGYLIASLSQGSFIVLLLGIGVVAGAGIGFGYVCPLSVGMKWFPDRKGLVTGVAVAGFGGGAILLSSIAGSFLQSIDVLVFLQGLGIIAGTVLLASAFFLLEPVKARGDAATVPPQVSILGAPFFILLFGIFAGTFSGLLVIGNLIPIVIQSGLSESMAIGTVSIFAAGNVTGRIMWGYIFDRLSYKAIPVSLGCFAVLIPLFLFPLGSWGIMAVVALTGFGFGANFVVYAGVVSRYFGTESFSRVYPLCFLGYGVAGLIGPSTGGWLADSYGSYNPALYLSEGILLLAFVVSSLGLRVFEKKDGKKTSSNQF